MLLPQHSRLLSRIAIPALLIAVVVAACGGSSERTIDIDPATGITQKGDALSLTIYVVDIEDDVYYKDTNGNIYVKRPSIPGNKIAAIFAQIRNHGATNVFIDVGHNSLELRDDSQGEYPPIDPFGDTVSERITKVVVDQLGVTEAQVVPNASFVDDLNADSLDLVELIMAIEEEFTDDNTKLEISDEDAEKIVTVQNAIDFVKEKGASDS